MSYEDYLVTRCRFYTVGQAATVNGIDAVGLKDMAVPNGHYTVSGPCFFIQREVQEEKAVSESCLHRKAASTP